LTRVEALLKGGLTELRTGDQPPRRRIFQGHRPGFLQYRSGSVGGGKRSTALSGFFTGAPSIRGVKKVKEKMLSIMLLMEKVGV
jgi:hypothetical protein